MVPVGANQLVGIRVRFFQHPRIHDKHGELVGRPPGLGRANQRLGRPPARSWAEPSAQAPSQGVMCSWLQAPSSRRDKPVAVVAPVELTR